MSVLQELLNGYQVRQRYKQKTAFLDWAQAKGEKLGYPMRIEHGKNSAKLRNLVVGDPEHAKIVLTAHYDTCAESPVPNLCCPEKIWISYLVTIPLVLVMLFLSLLVGFLFAKLTGIRLIGLLAYLLTYFGLFCLWMMGKPNIHTANDNTSGVALLLDLMETLPPEKREQTAFIFFDMEELGMVGSKQYFKAHRESMATRLVLNFDCVGNGDHLLVVYREAVNESIRQALKEAFASETLTMRFLSEKQAKYNSDQRSFPCGVGVATLVQSKLGLCIPRIHTWRDTVCKQENLDALRKGTLQLIETLGETNEQIG